VQESADSIASVGVLCPILVTRDGRLVAGHHRVAACCRLGLARVPCEYIEADSLHAELAEIDENLIRAELSVIEKGEALVRRDEILTELGVRATPRDNQRMPIESGAGETVSPAPKTTAKIAAEAGMTERSAQQHMQIAKKIIPSVREVLKQTTIGNSTRTLLALSRQSPELQQRYADAVQAGDKLTADEIAETYAPTLAPPIHGQPHFTELTISADVTAAADRIWEQFPAGWIGDLIRLLSERLAKRKG
jgi:ParB family transcriptional regulator, chromosome partitioning protein